MLLVWLFWLALFLPGFAVLSAVRPRDQPRFALESIALAYLLTFCVLSPVSILGYCLKLPLAVLSSAIAVSVVLGAAALWWRRRQWWQPPRADLISIVGFALLLFLMYEAAEIGGHMYNDADFHLARIRFLREHGLSNADPFVGIGFTHVYHTNFYHALIAAGSQLTGVDVLEFWSDTLPWSKLMLAAGVFAFGLRLGNHALGAWAGALAYLLWVIANNWTLYPNFIAPGWLMPVGLSMCFGALTSGKFGFHLAMLAAAAFVTAQVHGLYAGFLAVLVAFAVIPISVARLFTHRSAPARKQVIARMLALGLAVSVAGPFLYVAKETHAPIQSNFVYEGGSPTLRPRKADKWVKSLKRNDADQLYLPAQRLAGGPLLLALLLVALGLLAYGRREIAGMLWPMLAAASCVLLYPPIATWTAARLGEAWMLDRLLGVLEPLDAAVIGAGLLLPLANLVSGSLAAAVLFAATMLLTHAAGAWGPVMKVSRASLHGMPVPLTGSHIGNLEKDRRLLAKLIPPGSTVLTHPMAGRELAMLYDIKFLRVSRNQTGVDDLLDCTQALSKLLAARDLDEALPLLKRYHIQYALQSKQHRIRWLDCYGDVVGKATRFTVIRLLPSPP